MIATFFAIQANNVKFVFGPEHLEVKVGSDVSDMRESDNKIVGGANKWRCARMGRPLPCPFLPCALP